MADYYISPAAKSSSSPSSSDVISRLSDDLLAEIFKRLSFRHTASCKCVSKHWLNFISSPYFQTLFTIHQHSLYNALLIFLTPHQLMLVFPLPHSSLEYYLAASALTKVPILHVKANVCGCSNGLFLCCNNRYTTGTGYYVYNPLTKECTQIPPSPAVTTYKHEKLDDPKMYAVGFVCSSLSSFRVVIIKSFVRTLVYEFKLEVYSSETGRWKQVPVTCPEGFVFSTHWLLSYAYEGSLYFMGQTNIFAYDPYSTLQKSYYTLAYPRAAVGVNIMSFGFLGISCGCLRISYIINNFLGVWKLISGKWNLRYKIDLLATKQLPKKFCSNCYKKVVGFHPYDEDIVYLHSYIDGLFVAHLGPHMFEAHKFEAIPGYEIADMSPFQLDLSSFHPPPKPLSNE